MCCLEPPPALRILPGFGDGIPGLGPPPKPPWIKYTLQCNNTDTDFLSTVLPQSENDVETISTLKSSELTTAWLAAVRTTTKTLISETIKTTTTTEKTLPGQNTPIPPRNKDNFVPPLTDLPGNLPEIQGDRTTATHQLLEEFTSMAVTDAPESDAVKGAGALLSNELIAVVCLSILLAISLISVAICWAQILKNKRRRINPEDPKESDNFLEKDRSKLTVSTFTEDGRISPDPPSISLSLQRADSSTSGISTGCDNEEAEKMALRKKRPGSCAYRSRKTPESDSSRHLTLKHLPILRPISSRNEDLNETRFGNKTLHSTVNVTVVPVMSRDSCHEIKDFSLPELTGRQNRILLEPLDLAEKKEPKKKGKRKRKKIKNKRQLGRMSKSYDEDDLEGDSCGTIKDLNESQESYA